MSRRENLSLPAQPFGLLLVEGGDERELCRAILGVAVWPTIACWTADGGPSLPTLAEEAKRDANFRFARGIGIVLDAEESVPEALLLAARVCAPLGCSVAPTHATYSSDPVPVGVFLSPDGVSPGAIENLCRVAVTDKKLGACVDALVTCAGSPHTNAARAGKGWLQAYLALMPKPRRFHEAFGASPAIDPADPAFDGLRAFLRDLLT